MLIREFQGDGIQLYDGELYANGAGSTDLHYYQGSDISVSGEADITQKHVYAVDRNGAATKVYQDAKTAIHTGSAGTQALNRLILGANNTAGSLPLNGKIAEVISYNTVLSNADRGRVLDYLGARYGVTIGA